MPLSKARNRERMWNLRHGVQPMCNLKSVQSVQPVLDAVSPSVQREGYGKISLPNQPITPKKQVKQELQALIHTIEDKKPVQVIREPISYIPWYNSQIHSEGDTVRMKDPKTGEIKVVTL